MFEVDEIQLTLIELFVFLLDFILTAELVGLLDFTPGARVGTERERCLKRLICSTQQEA